MLGAMMTPTLAQNPLVFHALKLLKVPVQTEFCSLKWGTKGFSGEEYLSGILSFFSW